MKITSIKYVHELANKILGETQRGGSLSDREYAILHAGFCKLVDRLYATCDETPEVLAFLKELTVIASALTMRAVDESSRVACLCPYYPLEQSPDCPVHNDPPRN